MNKLLQKRKYITSGIQGQNARYLAKLSNLVSVAIYVYISSREIIYLMNQVNIFLPRKISKQAAQITERFKPYIAGKFAFILSYLCGRVQFR